YRCGAEGGGDKMTRSYTRHAAAAVKLLLALAVCGMLYWSLSQSVMSGRFAADVDVLTPENTMLNMPPPAAVDALPADSDFKTVAQSGQLTLKADPSTGHFLVEDRRSGNVYRSFP